MSYCIEKQTLACMAWVTHCYGQLEDSLDLCKPYDRSILKTRVFDMLDRVKYLLDKKYGPNPKGNADNTKFVKGENIMNAAHEEAYRRAENTITEVNDRFSTGKVKDPREHAMLTAMHRDATATQKNIHEMYSRPYSDTNIGYNTNDARQRMDNRGDTRGDTRSDAARSVVDAIGKILPHLPGMDDMDDMDTAEARQGVKGTGRGRGRGRVRSDMENTYNSAYADAYADAYNDAARSMYNNDARRAAENREHIYPPYTHPVMPRQDEQSNDNASTQTSRAR